MKAIVFDRFGEPSEVLSLKDLQVPEPGPNEVRVRMIASPINPSDLLVLRGQYGRLPQLPATPGFEGVGVVEAAGPGLFWRLRLRRLGRRVAVLNNQGGNWQEYVIVPVRQVVPISDAIPDDQAAAFFVNPATAFILTQRLLRIQPGEWLLQSAAASSLGRMIIQLGRHLGFRTINIVRRREQGDELRSLGADVVICAPEESIRGRVDAVTESKGVSFALDAVGGTTATEMVAALGYQGHIILYGTMSGERPQIDPREMMVRNLQISGFWLSNWVRQQGPLAMLRLFRELTRLVQTGVLSTRIAGTFPLEKFHDAVSRAEKGGINGKILLQMGHA
jgi:NADPH:quinone reductase-like Zn-dependent oxidoreductase